jgi:hypothetical protein
MRSRKLDNLTADHTDNVLRLASAVVAIGWTLIVLAIGGAIVATFMALGAQDGSVTGAEVLGVVVSFVVWLSLGLILLLLGRSSELNALAIKGNLIDLGVGVKQPRGRFATSRFGATLVPDADGARIIDVDRDGGAELAGLAADDVIVAMADLEPLTIASISELIRTSPPGTRLEVTYQRGDDEVTVELTLG